MMKRGAFFLALSVLGAIWCGSLRIRAEMADKRVELIADYESVASWAAALGSPLVELLKRLKREGLTACSVPELSLLDMERRGLARVGRGLRGITLRLAPEVREEALRSLSGALGGRVSVTRGAPSPVEVYIPSPPPQLHTLPIALDPMAVRAIKEAGLRLIPRPTNHPLASLPYVRGRLKAYKRAGASLLVFSGDSVWGHPRAIHKVADLLRANGLAIALTEFAKQAGAEALARRLLPTVVRLHSITEREIQNYTPQGMAARFVRAVKERRVRAVYIRLPPPSGEASFEEALKVVSETARGVRAAGYEVGAPSMPRFPDFLSTRVGPFIAALGGCSAFALAVSAGFEGLSPLGVALGLGLFLLLAIAVVGSEVLGAKLCALSSALSFPVLGVVLARRKALRGSPLRGAVWALGVASGLSLCGGLLVASSLSSPPFMLKIDQYAGVKISFLLPVLSIWLWRLGAGYELRPNPLGWWRRLLGSARRPVLYGHVAVLLFLLGLVALWILRTGNVPGVRPPEIELRLREALERWLYARPRFKEFAFAHPLLMIAALIERRAGPMVAALLWAGGAIGQASIVNSFCHLHTPLLVALLRTINGMWMGLLVGVAICWVLGGLLGVRGKK